ncbi:hypothetical protein CF328_g9394, partial [Tilletia controversa]
ASAARIEVLVEQYVAMFGMSRMEAYDHVTAMWFKALADTSGAVSVGATKSEPGKNGWIAGRSQLGEQQKTFTQLVKLRGRDNWHIWRLHFTSHLASFSTAQDHLEGLEHDDGFSSIMDVKTPGYNNELDIALGTLLVSTITDAALSPIFAIQRAGEQRGSVLYAVIRKHYEWCDDATIQEIQTTLATLKQGTHSITELNQTLEVWFSKAMGAGLVMNESQKVNYLFGALDSKYDPWVMTQNSIRSGVPEHIRSSYDHQMALLLGEEARRARGNQNLSARAFAIALHGSVGPSQSSSRGGHSSYRGQGRKSGAHRRSTKCHNCDQAGHWKNECPQPKRIGNGEPSSK